MFTLFFTVHKPKITVHGQWTVPDTHPGKKKIFLKTRKEAKRGRERESKPTLSPYLAIHWNFSYFNLKVIIFYLLLVRKDDVESNSWLWLFNGFNINGIISLRWRWPWLPISIPLYSEVVFSFSHPESVEHHHVISNGFLSPSLSVGLDSRPWPHFASLRVFRFLFFIFSSWTRVLFIVHEQWF